VARTLISVPKADTASRDHAWLLINRILLGAPLARPGVIRLLSEVLLFSLLYYQMLLAHFEHFNPELVLLPSLVELLLTISALVTM